MRVVKQLGLLGIAAALVFSVSPAGATLLTAACDVPFNEPGGDSPSATCFMPGITFTGNDPTIPPVIVEIQNVSPGVVNMVIQGFMDPNETMSEFDMNVKSAFYEAITLGHLTVVSSTEDNGNWDYAPLAGPAFGFDGTKGTFKADGDGYHTFGLTFGTGNDKFNGDDRDVIQISCDLGFADCAGFDATAFDAEGTNSGKGQFRIAVHVPPGWVGGVAVDSTEPNPQQIPNPPSLGLIGVALIGLGYVARKKLTK